MLPLRNAKYDDRETLKSQGARWNPEERYWYVPDGKDPGSFRDYMDDTTRDVYDSVLSHMQSLQKQPERHLSEEESLQKSTYQKPEGFEKIHFKKLGLPDDFVVIDTETTGLGKDDEVVELSVLDSGANELYHSFFKPGKQITPEAARVTGIETQHLASAPTFKDEWSKIRDVIGDRRIAGHNLQFDRRLIQQTLEKQTGRSHERSCDMLFDGAIDTYRLAQRSTVAKGSRSLGKLCDAMGVEQPPNHRTGYDCLGVLYVLQNFEKKDYGVRPRVGLDISHIQSDRYEQMSLI